MAGKIYMIKENGEFVEMEEKGHAREFDFQKLIEKYPDLIPGDQINGANPRKWLHIGSEVNFPIVGSGNIALDHLFLDQDGIPTLVEIKRAEDPRIKREVTSQIIEYGANLILSMDMPILKEKVENNKDADINTILNEDDDIDEFWQKVDKNFKSENIRLLVVADEIPQRLQNSLEFLNRNMENVEILAVEVKQYAKEGETTLVPRVIGQSIEAQTKKARSYVKPKLTKDIFFESLDEIGNKFYQEFFEFSEQNNFKINLGTTGFAYRVPVNDKDVKILEGYSGIAAHGQYLESSKLEIKSKVNNGDEIAGNYVNDILKIDGFEVVGDGFKFTIDKNLDKENWKLFKKILSNVADQIRTNGLIK